jgi:hypothetical protein
MSAPEDQETGQEGDDLFVDSPDALAEPSVDVSHFAFDGSEPVGTISEAQLDARFDGDTSALPAPVCYALQELIAAAHVSVRSRNWKTIEVHEEIIRSRLSELNLQLEINREHKYAFTRQVSENDPRQRNILRAQTLTLAASVLALFLRQKYLTSADDSVVVERGEIIDHMLTYKPVSDTDESGFIKRIDAAINQLESRKIIRALPGPRQGAPGVTDRYVVHGVIASLLGPEQVAAYTEAYRRLAGEYTDEGTDLTELDDQERTP